MSRDNISPEDWASVDGPYGEQIAKPIAAYPTPICWSAIAPAEEGTTTSAAQ